MFHSEFYPTPHELAERMAALVKMDSVSSVLEPSAGKGDLAAAIARRLNAKEHLYSKSRAEQLFDNLDIDTVEVSPELQHILKGKGLRVVHDDFLTFPTPKRYDLIIMNPPFSEGAKHLLKALEMQKNGGQIVCLLNAETLKNPYTNERRDLVRRLKEYGATIEFLQNAFATGAGAERKTDVEIALVYVNIPIVEPTSSIFENLRRAAENETQQAAEIGLPHGTLVENDIAKALVKQFCVECAAGLALIREYQAMAPHILTSFKKVEFCKTLHNSAPILSLRVNDEDSRQPTENAFLRAVRAKYWEAWFNNPHFTALLTSNLREEYQGQVEKMADYDFSLFNIYTIQEEINRSLSKGVEDTILALFEELSNTYHWFNECSKNIHYYNGWKTNKAYKINQKVIIPLNAFRSWDGGLDYTYNVRAKLGDIEKVLNYLDGGETEDKDLARCLDKAQAHGITQKIPCKYFTVTFYKKGTAHIAFTSDRLLKKLNIFGSRRLGWLPPSYGKAQYRDMTAEEKATVNEFEGAEEYAKTMRDTGYFLFSATSVLALEQGKPDISA